MVSSRHGRWSIGWNGGADGDGAFGRQERSNHWTMSKESTAVRRCFATLMMMPTIVTFTTDAEIFAWFQSENSGFLGGMWNFICEYLLKASVIQSVRAHTNRSRRHMILNEFPFAAFVRLLARIEIWIYILHSCVCDNNRILHIAYVSHERPFSANDVEDEKSHIDAWMLPLPFFNNSTYGRTKHHNQVQIKWKLIDSKYDIRWNGTIKWMTTKITKWSSDRLHSMSIQLAILEYIYILILMSGIFMALLWNVTPQVSHTESKRWSCT